MLPNINASNFERASKIETHIALTYLTYLHSKSKEEERIRKQIESKNKTK